MRIILIPGLGYDARIFDNLTLSNVDVQYLNWIEPQVLSTTEIVQIHGTNDKTLPYRLVNRPDFTIKDGSHICVINKPKEVSRLIINAVQQCT